MKKNILMLAALLMVSTCAPYAWAQTPEAHDHDTEAEHTTPSLEPSGNSEAIVSGENRNDDEHNNGIKLSQTQMKLAGVVLESISPKLINYEVYAPAEIKANGYTSYLISPRVDSVVVKRHVSLGEHVEKDQPLVTLFSESVAQAQADYRIDFAEWNRVRNLRTTTVSEKEKSEAQTRYIAALAYLRAFGLSEQAIESLTKDNSSALGEYTLYAAQPGSVLNDDFQQGQRVEAGEALLTLADEDDLWVEARLSPNTLLSIPKGAKARVSVVGESYPAAVIQEAHTIDPLTRTRVVRLLVDNHAHRLHSGMFADSYFKFETAEPVMAVPETALVRSSDGDWVIFAQEAPGIFEPLEVKLGRTLGQYREVTGIDDGMTVVTDGAFFIASEQAKSAFDPHNH